MKKLLFLDDDKTRHDAVEASSQHTNVEVIHCFTLDQFIAALKDPDNTTFSMVSLDHDLNDFDSKSVAYDGQEATGLDACGFLVRDEFATKLPDTIFIHSVNPCGAKNMQMFLESRGFNVVWIPFAEPLP